MATPSPCALPSGLQAIMPNYIAAAIQKAKNIAASIRGYCNPVSRGSLTLPIGEAMRSITSAQLGAAVERAALSLQDRTNQCREDVEELERADAIASRGLPADPAHWMRDIIVKFREAMTPEERAVNLRLALLDAERPVLATIAGLGTREIATITDDAISQIPFANSPPPDPGGRPRRARTRHGRQGRRRAQAPDRRDGPGRRKEGRGLMRRRSARLPAPR